MKEKKKVSFACFFCGEVSASENLTELDGKKMCPECLTRETIVCYHYYEDSRSHYYIGLSFERNALESNRSSYNACENQVS